jgi:hypothetical protein
MQRKKMTEPHIKNYHNPRIVCADGFSISVQAHHFAYCKPRQSEGPHTHMEGGFPSMIPGEELLGYMEGGEFKDPCDTVYPYVPREIFEREFEAHGGIVEGKLPL